MLFKELIYFIKRIALTLILLGIIYFIALLIVDDSSTEAYKTRLEIIKPIMQLIIVGIIGGIFINSYNNFRERKIAINEFRTTILRSITRSYSETKKARRHSRAKCEYISKQDSIIIEGIPYIIYDQQLTNINEIQLELEGLVRELEIIKNVFTKADQLINHIRYMEKYLCIIIKEYQTELKKLKGESCIPLSKLPSFNAFIEKNDNKSFDELYDHYHKSLKIIESERLKIT